MFLSLQVFVNAVLAATLALSGYVTSVTNCALSQLDVGDAGGTKVGSGIVGSADVGGGTDVKVALGTAAGGTVAGI